MDERTERNRWIVVLVLVMGALLLAANLAKAQEIRVQRSYPRPRYTPAPAWRPVPSYPVMPAYWAQRPIEVKVINPPPFPTLEPVRRPTYHTAQKNVALSFRPATINHKNPLPCSWDWYLLVLKDELEDTGECR